MAKANKTQPTPVHAADHVAGIADPERRGDAEALLALLGELSGEPPVMWGPSIVGFGRYTYRYESGRSGESPRIGFASRGRETVLYLVGGFERHAALLERLGPHRTSRSCLYVRRLADLDPAILRQILCDDLDYMDATYPRET